MKMYCAAADILVPGVGKAEVAQFVRNLPGRGGVGTYCHTNAVHVDVGPERDWNWPCGRRSGVKLLTVRNQPAREKTLGHRAFPVAQPGKPHISASSAPIV